MKNRIKNKLRSRAGASITFALLLFLVCAVLCSVILTAATASSGRMSQIAETDQRYYAVTSAAELLKGTIDGETVSIVKVDKSWTNTTYSAGEITKTEPAPVPEGEVASVTYLVAGKKATEIGEKDLVDVNKLDVVTIDTLVKEAAKKYVEKTVDGPILTDRLLKLSSSFYTAEELDYDTLAVTVEEDLDAEGNIEFILYNTYKAKKVNSSSGDQYRLTLAFGTDKSETSDTKAEDVSWTASSDDAYVVTTKTTQTTVTSLTWNLREIKTNP